MCRGIDGGKSSSVEWVLIPPGHEIDPHDVNLEGFVQFELRKEDKDQLDRIEKLVLDFTTLLNALLISKNIVEE